MEDMETQTTAPETPVETTTPETPVETPAEPKGTTEEVAFEPNYTFSIKDEKFEMDEWSRAMIKDKDTEDKFRDLFTSARALDTVKESREKLQGEYDTVNSSHSELQDSLSILRDHVGNRDFDSFLKALNIPKEWVQQWMYQDLQRGQMPPEQQTQYDQHLTAVREATELRRSNEQLTQQQESMQRDTQERELQGALQEPNVNQFMRDFDARTGQVGAFREKVVAYAIGQYHATGRDLTANEAINELMSFAGGTQVDAQSSQAQSQVVAPQQKPVIPNIQGRNSSPVRKAPKSFEEMREQYKQVYGNE